MNLRESVAKLFSANILLSVLEFIGIAYFTRVLGAGAIGSFFLYQTVIGIAAIGSNFGVSRAAERDLSSGDRPGEVMVTTVVLLFGLLIPFVGTILLVQPYLDAYIGIQGVSQLVAIGLITTQARRLVIRLLAGQMRVQQTASLRVIGKLIWVSSGIGLILGGMDAAAIVVGFIAGDIAVALTGLYRLDSALGKPSVKRAHSQLKYGFYIMLRSSGSYLYSWMDVAVLGFFVSSSLVGAYEIAWRVAALSLQLTNAIRESLFPKISELHSAEKTDEIRTVLFRWLQPPVYITVPGFFGALVLGEAVLGIPFGQEVIVAVPVLVLFMAEKTIRAGHLLFSAAVYAMDRPELGYRAEVIALAVNGILNLALIPPFGIIGGAVATTVSSVVAALINWHYLSQLVDLRLPIHRFGWSTLCALLMAGSVFLAKPFLPNGWMGLLGGVGLGIVVYSSLLISNSKVREELLSFRRIVP